MVTKYFMEKMMVSARESRKTTKLIECVGLITRPARLAADHVERHERAEDVFAVGTDDKHFHGDKCIVRRERLVDGAHKAASFAPDSRGRISST